MKAIADKIKRNKYFIGAIKLLLSLYLVCTIGQALFLHGLKPYLSYKDYTYQTPYIPEQTVSLTTKRVSQTFTSKGNILSNISIYLGDIAGENIEIIISNTSEEIIASTIFSTNDYAAQAWNNIGINCTDLKRGEEYTITFSSESSLHSLSCYSGGAPSIFGQCRDNNGILNGILTIGLQFTYTYLTLGNGFEFVLKIFFSLIMGLSLCYAIWDIESLYLSFKNSGHKKGIWYALYFSVSLIFLFNPLEMVKNKVTTFNRLIGASLMADIDVSKRIDNFTHWFILFAIAFALFYLLSNSILDKEKSKDCLAAQKFLDHFIVLADCNLLLKCITYFYDAENTSTIYYFSSYVIMLITMTTMAYIVLRLDKNVTVDQFSKLVMIGVSLSFPITIFVALEWDSGKVLLGVMTIVSMLLIALCKWGKRLISHSYFQSLSTSGALILSLLPLMTSAYIELVHLLNQHSIFVAHPAKYYKIAFILTFTVFVLAALLIKIKEWNILQWKKWAYPWFIAGITCLSVQLPLSATYNPHWYENANYSILISDFLNYKTIPIVEHYGGHMMTDVLEGILYGLLNNDYRGIVNLYSVLVYPLLAILFYYFMKNYIDENIALFVTLLFPFYEFFSYYGLGMLVCLAIVSYVKKNSYKRAALIWLAFIWCTLYRLDLGFSFGIAAIIALTTYIIATKNLKAAKELIFTLIGWGVIGITAWFAICLAKSIHPLYRLAEFLKISLSNQTWAYAEIGDPGKPLFSWFYLIIPFAMIVCLLYTTFSKKMREQIGNANWILLLVLGWSYFENFSRGLVRHSLAESATKIVLWCSYLFLASFLSCYKKNSKLFLPAFMLLILCNVLFMPDRNFIRPSIADNAVSRPASIIESWEFSRFDEEENIEKTYWEQLKENAEVVERIKLDDEFMALSYRYTLLLNILLEENDTFVDFINQSLLYSLIERKNPVYISQSPMQLSGEFTQEEFVREIDGVPIVLMPISETLNSLDGITNAYRDYKVVEYIYQNYVPLCKYGNYYAIWCLPSRYTEFKNKICTITSKTEYISDFMQNDNIGWVNAKPVDEGNGNITIISGKNDPMITELQNMIDISPYIGIDMVISIEYTTDIPGILEVFYTTEPEEYYTNDQVITVEISESGQADFTIPVTEYTKLRLDTPENSTITIKSFNIQSACDYAAYGYDGPYETIDINDDIIYTYTNSLHNYCLGHLPRIWAEEDKKNAADNTIISDLTYHNGIYLLDSTDFRADENGNYLKIAASYDGSDADGLYADNDEELNGTVILGNYQNNQFVEKCRYSMTFMEGNHEYLIRCSTDYYWYIGDINAVKIQTDDILHNITMQILEGD